MNDKERSEQLHSIKVHAEGRTYFFDVKRGKKGGLFLSITESKRTGESEFERHNIVIWWDQIPAFTEGFLKSITELSDKN